MIVMNWEVRLLRQTRPVLIHCSTLVRKEQYEKLSPDWHSNSVPPAYELAVLITALQLTFHALDTALLNNYCASWYSCNTLLQFGKCLVLSSTKLSWFSSVVKTTSMTVPSNRPAKPSQSSSTNAIFPGLTTLVPKFRRSVLPLSSGPTHTS
jgi:hypothetical protein